MVLQHTARLQETFTRLQGEVCTLTTTNTHTSISVCSVVEYCFIMCVFLFRWSFVFFIYLCIGLCGVWDKNVLLIWFIIFFGGNGLFFFPYFHLFFYCVPSCVFFNFLYHLIFFPFLSFFLGVFIYIDHSWVVPSLCCPSDINVRVFAVFAGPAHQEPVSGAPESAAPGWAGGTGARGHTCGDCIQGAEATQDTAGTRTQG